MRAINIDWDVDFAEDKASLPITIEIPKGMTDEDEISDYLSEQTGYCHKGFDLVEEPALVSKSAVLRELLQSAKEDLNECGEIGYTMPDGNYHIYISVDDIGDVLNGSELVYRIEPNKLDEHGCAEPLGDIMVVEYNDFAELLVGCVWCMEQFEADMEQQKEFNRSPRIEVDLGYATLVAETGYDQNYKEITVGLEDKDGAWVQDLAMVGGKYHYDEKATDPALEIVQDKGISVKVWTDKDDEDYTHDFSVDIYETEEILGVDNIEEEYETDERYFVYDADDNTEDYGFKYEDDAISWAKEHHHPTVKVHKYFYDDRGKIRPDGVPEVIWTDAVETQKQALDDKMNHAVIDLEKLNEYLKEEMIIEFNSDKECMDYFNLYDGQNFKSVEEMKAYQGDYGFGYKGKWYHISFDEALDVRMDGQQPSEQKKSSLDEKIQSAASKVVADVKENASKTIELK